MRKHDEVNARFVELYRQLEATTTKTFDELSSLGVVGLLTAAQTERVTLGVDQVVCLASDFDLEHLRDHLIQVHLADLEARLYRGGQCEVGHMVRIMGGNYSLDTEEMKQATIVDGFPLRVATVSSEVELIEATPLRVPSDTEYSVLYDELVDFWGNLNQRTASEKMWYLLETIHSLLPKSKIGDDFRRERRGREEPLPMYVRNEIHHPTKGPLLETEAFKQDKCIGYAIMEAWLSEDRNE